MNSALFWEIVEKVNWPALCAEHSRPYEEGKRRMLLLLPSESWANKFQNTFSQHKGRLMKVLEQWEEEGAELHGYENNPHRIHESDDSFSDLLCHIIGLGKESYEAALNNPLLVKKLADEKYTSPFRARESFSYCIPFPEDYDPPEKKLARELDGEAGRAAPKGYSSE